jgi:cyclophilin family peptidyl-prolyl cis-trans isomerase
MSNEMRKSIFIIIISILIVSDSCAKKNNADTVVSMETTYGNITVKLYPETIKHHDNFVKLVNEGFYNGVSFHRVIANFMIQAGDPESKIAKSGVTLGSGDVGYTIPAEFIYPRYYHKRGALCAARQGDDTNPMKASSGCQFYLVVGKVFSESALDSIERSKKLKLEHKLFQDFAKLKEDEVNRYRLQHNQAKLNELRDSILMVVDAEVKKNSTYKFTEQQRNDYKTLGGTPHLDGEYTVFGEVTEGLDIVEKISKARTDRTDRPVVDIKVIKAEIIK